MSSGKSAAWPIPKWGLVIVPWLFFFCLSLLLQWRGGAWESDFGGHADEAAHVVTGLMVRDYLAGGFIEEWHPLRYAQDYYERFPKVAIGHYPPVFYVVEGTALLFWRSPFMVLLLMAAVTAFVANQTRCLARDFGLGELNGWVLGATFCLLPLVQTYTGIVMSDLLLVLFILAATRSMGRFMAFERGRDAWMFGFLAAAAILTKGSGLLLALVPPVAIALTGKWKLLKSPKLWLAPLPVLALALPWMLATRHITAEGMAEVALTDYLANAFLFYLKGLPREIGWGAMLVVLIGLDLMLVDAWRSNRRIGVESNPEVAALWALVVGLLVFYVSVPSGLDLRYLLPVFPPVLVLGSLTLRRAEEQYFRRAPRWGTIILALVIGFETWRPVEKRYSGASEAIESIVRQKDSDQTTVLVVSNASGEGALTAAAAFSEPKTLKLLRGSKVLATSDWLGRGYEVAFHSERELKAIFTEQSVDFIVIEDVPETGTTVPAHWTMLSKILLENSSNDGVEQVGEIQSFRKFADESRFLIFRVTVAPGGETEPRRLDAEKADQVR